MGLFPVESRAARPWVEVKSAHFTVLSPDSEKDTRSMAWQFEQVRQAMQTLWPWARVDADKPIVILAAPDTEMMKALAPMYFEGRDPLPIASVFVEAADRYYILIRTDTLADSQDGINPYYNAYRSYLGLIIRSSVRRRLPLWVSNGLGAVYANTLVRDKEIQIGRVVPWLLRTAREEARLPIRELLTVDASSPWYTTDVRRGSFEAESWALMHMLLFADLTDQQSKRVGDYLALLAKDTPPVNAFTQVFGEPDKLEDALAKYMSRPLLSYRRLAVDARVRPEQSPWRALPPVEVSTTTAAFHAATNRPKEARADLAAARTADAAFAGIADADALLLDTEKDDAALRAMLERAVTSGSTNFYSYYRLAALHAASSSAPVTRIEELLRRSVALNDRFAPSHVLLANLMMSLGRSAEGEELAARAVDLAPWAFVARLAHARTLQASKRLVDAFVEARRAAALVSDSPEAAAVEEVLQALMADAVKGVPAQPAALAVPPNAVRTGGTVTPPTLIKSVPAEYPELAKAAKVQGVVVLEALVGPDGKVVDARPLRSIPLLDAAAVEAVKKREYQPTVVGGGAVPLVMSVTLNFTLQ